MSKLENLTKEETVNHFISVNFDYKHDKDNNNCDNNNGNRYDTNNAICNMKHRFASKIYILIRIIITFGYYEVCS